MRTEIKTVKPSKPVHPVVAYLVLIAFASALFVVGVIIGKAFFWENYDTTPIADRIIEVAQQKVAKDPKNPKNYVDLGWGYFQKKDYNNALAQYKKALDLDKKYYPAYLNLGILYIDTGKYDLAVNTLKQAVALQPKSSNAHLNLGIAYNKLEKYQEALKELKAAYELSPGSTRIIYEIGVAYEKMGKIEDAKYQYKSALEFDPKFEDAKKALERLNKK
ncbi:tetratricopeptide repeat protein [Carboxydothermus pertinax]|uniref:Uncharacterized protein n=1 Tax=Carboxydothermus pertinax TaxID=870242 RepID=A0A1L8CYP9_9THEO|nr:tetratricopeptide repeat protein [Carboxydothermus pertinax]GAV23994.1 hypothetical protein cpu_25040 [Carboxydothermus pertinax]